MDRKRARARLTICPSSIGAAPLGGTALSAGRSAGPFPTACGAGALHAAAHPANNNTARLEDDDTKHLPVAMPANPTFAAL
ncbi:hypothetical protein WMF45_26460 [Sorangium sp. So ce448]|uniref:hypothetical protein n=1 Tax=Sorangium sp. So ce448 TaxID=3133314 RepID=UPI003F5F4DDC